MDNSQRPLITDNSEPKDRLSFPSHPIGLHYLSRDRRKWHVRRNLVSY